MCPSGKGKELASTNMCHLGKKRFPIGATFRPDPCTNCTCQANSTTVCFRDIHRRGSSSSTCPNVHPATITVAPPAAAAAAVASPVATTTTVEPASTLEVVSIQQEAAASTSSLSASKFQQANQPQARTSQPAHRPLTCAYRGVTYQVSFSLLLLLLCFPRADSCQSKLLIPT